jgi:hypothetical protein
MQNGAIALHFPEFLLNLQVVSFLLPFHVILYTLVHPAHTSFNGLTGNQEEEKSAGPCVCLLGVLSLSWTIRCWSLGVAGRA